MTSQGTEAAAVPATPPASERSRLPWRSIALVVVGVLAAAAGLGALGGWLWYQWWGPPNTGEIYDTATWGPRWFDLTDQGLAHQFDGPAQYAVIALGFGTVLGILAAALGRRQPVAAAVALAAGSGLAAYLSWVVGTALSPPDPQQFATEDNIGKEYLARLELSSWTPLLCWPIAALGAFCIAIVAGSWLGELRSRQTSTQDAGGWLEPTSVSPDRSVP